MKSRAPGYNYQSSTDEDDYDHTRTGNKDGIGRIKSPPNDADSSAAIHLDFGVSRAGSMKDNKALRGNSGGDWGRPNAAISHMFSESDAEENLVPGTSENCKDYIYNEENYELKKDNQKNNGHGRNIKNFKELDETWDSD